MFGLGPTELIVILVLALLVLGPQRIPEAASSLGKAIRGFRRATRELRDQIDIDDDVRRPFEDLRSALRDEPPPLPPPPLQTPSTGGDAVAAAGAIGSALVKPPAEPVLSQSADSEGGAAVTGDVGPASPAAAPIEHDGHRPARGEPPLAEPEARSAAAPSAPPTERGPAAASDGKPESAR
ncbi:MAG: twin-arginine translocase TatA/TatE family subunit [Myxococcales bacterium]|nr:twin-arginine translocase TatA/TatE family subunit [Myxococcales bacterium]